MPDIEAADANRVSMLTTMHYVIQTQRMGTISESTGRASMFLSSVSMALVALGFIAQATELGDAFYAFALALIAALLMVGLSTHYRAVQLGAEDGVLAVAAERIRAGYVELSPGIERWFVVPLTRDGDSVELSIGVARSRWQILLTAASMIAVVNAALAGVASAIALVHYGRVTLVGGALSGFAVFMIVFTLHLTLAMRLWRRADAVKQASASEPQATVNPPDIRSSVAAD